MEEPHNSQQEIDNGRNHKTCGHKSAHIAIVSDEAIKKLADCIHKKKGGAHKTQLSSSQHTLVDEWLLDNTETHPANIVQTIRDRRAPESSAAQ